MAPLAIAELSLCGLISRLKEVEHIKGIKSPDDEQAAILSTETDVKKALFEQLQAAKTDGVASFEKKVGKEFLQEQLKSIDETSKGGQAKKSKLQELLTGLEAASSREDPAHVRRAKQDVAKSEKAFEDIRKDYERWEKGKKMLNIDEIKVLKRSFEESKAKVEKARAIVEEQQLRRAEAAVAPVAEEKERGAAALAAEARSARARAVASKAPSRPMNPSVTSKAAAPAGYPPKAAAVAPAALRQAQVAAQVRAEAEVPSIPASAPAPRPRPAPRPKAEDAPVLSYACTCTAVAQHLGITEAQARELAESARDFAQHFDAETWEALQEKSLAIEKANQEKQREAERRKKEKALAKVTQVQSSAAAVGAGAGAANAKTAAKAVAQAVVGRSPDPIAAKAKPKVKAKSTAKELPRHDGLSSLAGANKFGSLESDDEEEGWAKVRR